MAIKGEPAAPNVREKISTRSTTQNLGRANKSDAQEDELKRDKRENKVYVKRSRSYPRFASKFLTVGSFQILPTHPNNIRWVFDPVPTVENEAEEFFSSCQKIPIMMTIPLKIFKISETI